MLEMETLFGQTRHLGGGDFTGICDQGFAPEASSNYVDFDSLFDPDDVLQYLCFPSPEPPEILNPPELADDFESYQCPKRRKINFTDDLHYNSLPGNTSCFTLPEPGIFHATPTVANNYFIGGGGGGGGGGYEESLNKERLNNKVSAQSVAARKRRRKISQKTAELGKLVPGGNRLNTADMFHAAYKYIKFLEAQVGILQLMRSTQGEGCEEKEEDRVFQVQQGLELLLASPTIHEKLYSEEKCLVPTEFIANKLMKVDGIQSNPFISKRIDLLTPLDRSQAVD